MRGTNAENSYKDIAVSITAIVLMGARMPSTGAPLSIVESGVTGSGYGKNDICQDHCNNSGMF